MIYPSIRVRTEFAVLSPIVRGPMVVGIMALAAIQFSHESNASAFEKC